MEAIQQYYDTLILEMEEKFESKLNQLNKRFHVMETQLKQKIKQLDTKLHQKKEDLESIKLKAKICSLEKQILQLQNREFVIKGKEPFQEEIQIDHFSEILGIIQKQFQIQDLALSLFPQIDSILPHIIEVLPHEINLFSDFTLLLYKIHNYVDFQMKNQINDLNRQRQLNKTIENHVNDVMFQGGSKQDFEISFNPKSQKWIKKMKAKDQETVIPKNHHCLKLTQSLQIQKSIVRIIDKQLNKSYALLDRDNNQKCRNIITKQYRQKKIIEDRLNYCLQLLILGYQREHILISLQNISNDLQIKNKILTQYLSKLIIVKDINYLILQRIEDFKDDMEIIYQSLELIQQYKRNDIIFQYFLRLQQIVQNLNDPDLQKWCESLNY